ncbi:MAG: hypothetical protein JW942_09640 [Opitutales bacterium]|nr:hypothetical protein [Opitutales bacterium]
MSEIRSGEFISAQSTPMQGKGAGASVYLYGMVVQSTIHRLVGEFPELDTYGEFDKSHYLPGGEAGNSAVVLRNFGHKVRLDGPFLGRRTKEPVLGFYTPLGIDCTGMEYREDFEGVEDLVIVSGSKRTVFGSYQHLYAGPPFWTPPSEDAIARADIVGLDPFFCKESEEVARLCVKHSVPYVTIDCAPESFMAQNAAALVISNEYLKREYPGRDATELFLYYAQMARGLVIFTCGTRRILFGRNNDSPICAEPFRVQVVSTLGAGDCFRAGVMQGLLQGLDDGGIVRYAAATAAVACTGFPIGLFPPSQSSIDRLIYGHL